MLLCVPFFQCGGFGHLSLTCTKLADTSKSSARRDWLDRGLLTTDDTNAQQVECDFLATSLVLKAVAMASKVAWSPRLISGLKH